ncbi:MAG: hypothetical protein MUC57_01175 [Desulfobacterales bacterium]|jgi:hypothetical protein|nr:hypothetical protein [Desulfobacterales bacterium]
MQVTRYQMHNVLECYGKKLSRTRGTENISSGPSRKSTDEMALSSDTSRMAAMDKISRQVLDKVMDVVALSGNGKSGRYSIPADDAAAEIAGEPASMEFTRHPPDAIERQRTARLTLGDS